MKVKTKSNVLIAIFALATILGVFGFIVGTVSANSEPTVIEVYPTGDVNLDGDNIQAAIDSANPGDEIILKAGTFMLGKYVEVDDSWVSTSRGSFRHVSDLYPMGARDSVINPLFNERGGYEGESAPFPQLIVVDKPLIIRGEDSSDSENPTVITVVNTWLETGNITLTGINNGMGGLYTDHNYFVIASSDVTIKNLRFYSMILGLQIISAGTTIEYCVFEDSGPWPLSYDIDDYSVYPNYPSYNNPVKSYLRRNQFINVTSAIHMFGSEITMTENYVEIKLNVLGLSPYTVWAIIFGGFVGIPNLYTSSICRNNLVDDNIFEGDENSWYGAFVFSGYGPPIIENKITHNTVRNMWAMVENWGFVPVERNTITNNVAEDVGHGLFGPGYGILFDSANYIPTIIGNDYTQSNAPGWFFGAGSVFLGGATLGNFVSEGLFPQGTTMYEQILDFGTNAIPGSGVFNNNPGLAQHLQEVLTKQREMRN
jgi:hypothetical protein